MKFVLLLASVFSLCAHAQSESTLKLEKPSKTVQTKSTQGKFGSRSIGHLVTPNNNLLEKGETGFGTLYAAYGFTDHFSFGVSPFALLGFNMVNFMGRLAKDVSTKERVGFDFAYFKTFDDGDRTDYQFKMEAWDIKFTYNNLLKPWYRMNISTSFYYYINDERPFSLRMDPGRAGEPYALNLTSLHEFRLMEGLFVNFEGGFWGLNYAYPYYHVGTTLNMQSESFLFGLGVSTTFSPSFPKEKAKTFAGYESPQSIHPELQVQAFF